MRPRIRSVIETVIAFGAMTAANFGASYAAAQTGSRFITLTVPLFAMLAAVFAVSRIFGHPSKEDFNISAPSPRYLIPSAAMGVGGYFIIAAAAVVMAAVLPSLTNETDALLYDNYLKEMSPAAVIISVVVLPAVCEELIFRGFFLNRMLGIAKPLPAVILTGALFGVAHFDLYKLLPVTLMGTALAYIAYKTRSFVIPALLHMINNAISVISMYGGLSGDSPVEGYAVIPELQMELIYALGYLALGGGLVFLALRMFGTVRPKKLVTILIPVVCAAVYFTSSFGAVLSVTRHRLTIAGVCELPENAVVEKQFKLDRTRYTVISVSVAGRDLDAAVVILDSEGNEVRRYDDGDGGLSVSDDAVLDGGDYTFRCEVTAADGSPGEGNYVISVNIYTLYALEEPSGG